MNLARTIVLPVSVAAGLLAAYLAYILVKPSPNVPVVQRTTSTEVVVVIKNIAGGEVIQEADLRWIEWPEQGVTPGMITRAAEPSALRTSAGKIALQAITAGEPLRKERILDTAGGGTISAILPPGKRAYAILIDEKTTAGGFILPNDRVDILTVRPMQGNQPGTAVVIRGAKVIAIGHRIDPTGEKIALGRLATIEVTPEQLELLSSLEKDGAFLLTPLSLLESKNAENSTAERRINLPVSFIGKSL
jgi:pilus assembly protein CpaB